MKLEQALDPTNPGEWVLVEDTPDFRRYELDMGDHVIRRTEHKHTEQLLDANSRMLNDSINQRWGDGKVVGSIPLNLFYSSGLQEALRQRDKKFVARFLNDSDNSRFRTFGGTV